MSNKIRVTETRVYEYTPDLNEDSYQIGVESINDGRPARTIEDMVAIDQHYYNEGQIDLDDIADSLPKVTSVWEVVDVVD